MVEGFNFIAVLLPIYPKRFSDQSLAPGRRTMSVMIGGMDIVPRFFQMGAPTRRQVLGAGSLVAPVEAVDLLDLDMVETAEDEFDDLVEEDQRHVSALQFRHAEEPVTIGPKVITDSVVSLLAVRYHSKVDQ
jgi:hypothetical protein